MVVDQLECEEAEPSPTPDDCIQRDCEASPSATPEATSSSTTSTGDSNNSNSAQVGGATTSDPQILASTGSAGPLMATGGLGMILVGVWQLLNVKRLRSKV